tara:strand:+ start:463 stop:876 length:414 start_codon:yes stop_codon:yes gene_type:complete
MTGVDPVFLASLIWAIVGLTAGYNQIRQAIGKNQPPQPFTVKAAAEYTPLILHHQTKEEIYKHLSDLSGKVDKTESDRRISVAKVYDFTRDAIESQRQETKADMKELQAKFSEEAKGIHERINLVLVAVSKLEGPAK